jgi:hypothetical protein
MMVGHGLGPPFDFTSLTLRFAQGTRRERFNEKKNKKLKAFGFQLFIFFLI